MRKVIMTARALSAQMDAAWTLVDCAATSDMERVALEDEATRAAGGASIGLFNAKKREGALIVAGVGAVGG